MTGGYQNNEYISSTEVHLKGATSWSIKTNSLPGRISRLASISVGNEVLISGI